MKSSFWSPRLAAPRGARAGCPAFVNTEESITICSACARPSSPMCRSRPREKWADAVGDVVLTHEPAGGAAAWPHAPADALGAELARALRGGDVAGFFIRCGALRRAQERTKGVPEAALRGAGTPGGGRFPRTAARRPSARAPAARAGVSAPPPCAPAVASWLELSLAEPAHRRPVDGAAPFELRASRLRSPSPPTPRSAARARPRRPQAPARRRAAGGGGGARRRAARRVRALLARDAPAALATTRRALAAVDEAERAARAAGAAALTERLTPLGRAAAFGHVWRSVAAAERRRRTAAAAAAAFSIPSSCARRAAARVARGRRPRRRRRAHRADLPRRRRRRLGAEAHRPTMIRSPIRPRRR